MIIAAYHKKKRLHHPRKIRTKEEETTKKTTFVGPTNELLDLCEKNKGRTLRKEELEIFYPIVSVNNDNEEVADAVT